LKLNPTQTLRIRTARYIAVRGLKTALFSPGMYLSVTVGCVLASAVVHTYVGAIAENGLLIASDLLTSPLYLATSIGVVYLAVATSVSVSRERDSGTLEVLFYGPVDAVGYVTGKYLEQLLVFASMLCLQAAALLVWARLTNFGFARALTLGIILSIGLASSVTSLGLWLSTVASSTRAAMTSLIALIALFLGIEWSQTLLADANPAAMSPILARAASALSAAGKAAVWVSPFANMDLGMRAIASGNAPGYVLRLAYSAVYSAVFLVLCVVSLRRKGVRGK
jgi:ABC-type transport system involved in multi-copper enzyme maturation permease subunit